MKKEVGQMCFTSLLFKAYPKIYHRAISSSLSYCFRARGWA